jgi:hypothetical protein
MLTLAEMGVVNVINDGPRRVAPTTAARGRAAIEILDYRPNVNAPALKNGSTEMLGLVLPDITNPFFAEYARAIEVAAAAHGYFLVVATSDADDAYESQIVSDLAGRHLDGLILHRPHACRFPRCQTPWPAHSTDQLFYAGCRLRRGRAGLTRRRTPSGGPSHHCSWPPIDRVDHG